ncbi:MAG: hypothetical protein LRY76_05845 [Alphaproteobacteria bacterium]|nr:hypothetical protein [Alphaproteobacteria bacterium]
MVSTTDKELIAQGKRTTSHQLEEVTRSAPKGLKPGAADYLAGEAKQFVANLQPYLPQELIGGTIPHILGQEEESVWNAASQACGTEKVHFCYTLEDKKNILSGLPIGGDGFQSRQLVSPGGGVAGK